MGEKVAAIIMAMLGVIAGYNILTHGSAAEGITQSASSGGVGVIKALEGR